MLTKRIIACLDVKNGRVVKGVGFRHHTDMGDIAELAQRYVDQGADELVFYDITASPDRRALDVAWIKRLSRFVNIPFCVAGGIDSVEVAEQILRAGADKVSINSPALRRPPLINELSQYFGSQCVVVGIDSQAVDDVWWVWRDAGRVETIQQTELSTKQWIQDVQQRGAGEIVLNCIDRDGSNQGYDIAQLKAMKPFCQVPLIASGGAGSPLDFERAFVEAGVEGALAAGVFHREELTVGQVKNYLMQAGLPVRPNPCAEYSGAKSHELGF